MSASEFNLNQVQILRYEPLEDNLHLRTPIIRPPMQVCHSCSEHRYHLAVTLWKIAVLRPA